MKLSIKNLTKGIPTQIPENMEENMATAMSAAMSEVISKLLEQPMKDCGEKQRGKNLCEKEAKHLTDDTGTGSAIV